MDSLPVLWALTPTWMLKRCINEYFAGEIASPFWGAKKSGIGRERGLETLANYTRVKNVVINIGR